MNINDPWEDKNLLKQIEKARNGIPIIHNPPKEGDLIWFFDSKQNQIKQGKVLNVWPTTSPQLAKNIINVEGQKCYFRDYELGKTEDELKINQLMIVTDQITRTSEELLRLKAKAKLFNLNFE